MTYHNQTNTQWTPERVEQLRSLRSAGKSFAEIAALLNMTRNMIAGKCRRLDLPVHERRDRVAKPRKRKGAASVVVPLLVPFRATRRGTCMYVYGEPGTFSYCGHATDGGSYCAGHAALVYRRAA